MQSLAWVNEQLAPLPEVFVPIEDRGYLFGDGVYETIRVYNSAAFMLQAHLERLERSATAIRIELPYTIKEISRHAEKLIAAASGGDGYLYMQLTRGSAPRDHLFPTGVKAALTMFVRALPPLEPASEVRAGSCITLPDERWLNCHIKTVNLLPNLLARQAAQEKGADEAIMYRAGGIVTEGSRTNVFALIDGVVRTHPATNLILDGITRQVLIGVIKGRGIELREEAFTLDQLSRAEEAWTTSTIMEVAPIAAIDRRTLPSGAPGPLTAVLVEEYKTIIARQCKTGRC